MPAKDHSHPAVDEPQAAFSSPPCYAHEVDPAYLGLTPAIDPKALQAMKSTLVAAITALQSVQFP